MSVQNVSRFAAWMAVDFSELPTYLEDPLSFFSSTESMQQLLGELTDTEIELVEEGDFTRIFEYVSSNAPRGGVGNIEQGS